MFVEVENRKFPHGVFPGGIKTQHAVIKRQKQTFSYFPPTISTSIELKL